MKSDKGLRVLLNLRLRVMALFPVSWWNKNVRREFLVRDWLLYVTRFLWVLSSARYALRSQKSFMRGHDKRILYGFIGVISWNRRDICNNMVWKSPGLFSAHYITVSSRLGMYPVMPTLVANYRIIVDQGITVSWDTCPTALGKLH